MYNGSPNEIFTKAYPPTPYDEKEILRYAGCKDGEGVFELLKECLLECENALSYRVCYRVLTKRQFLSFIPAAEESKSLQARLQGRDEVVLFAATVGLGVDRLMEKYGKISPVKALFFQAIGAERIENLCESFCQDLQEEYAKRGKKVGVRFSAGYGDFPLSAQKEIFALLDCPKKIGLTLNDSLLMTPTKSVTAVVGIEKV